MLETSLITDTRDHFDIEEHRRRTLYPSAWGLRISQIHTLNKVGGNFACRRRLDLFLMLNARAALAHLPRSFWFNNGTISWRRRDICSKIPACSTFFFSFGGGHDGSLRVQLEREHREKKKMIPRDGAVKPICADFWTLYSPYTFKVEPVTFFRCALGNQSMTMLNR